MYKTAIIGAGVVGAMAARRLSSYDMDLVILEKEEDVAMGQSKANSGIVHAGFDPLPGSLKAKMNVQGNAMMEKTAEELGVSFRRNGSLILAFTDEECKALKRLYERGLSNGVPKLKLVSGEEARRIEKNLPETVKMALYAGTGGVICPYELTIEAVGNAMDNGARLIRNFEVVSISRDGGAFIIEDRRGRKIEAEYVINCAGLYSDEIAAMIGDNSFKITPRAGEYMLLDKEAGWLTDATIFKVPDHMGKGVLATRTVDGNILLGPTSVDRDDKKDDKVTVSGLETVKEKEKLFFGDIPYDKVITQFAGLRAHGDKGDFIINSPACGFINAAGIESPGLTSAPAIALEIERLLIESGFEAPKKKNYEPRRSKEPVFREASPEEKDRLIKKDPDYGHVVCRCEEVTKAEIIRAIRRNPKATDVDGIKRRTRSGMGRCQGGFCMPQVLEILAQETGKDPRDITKKGGSSRILYDRVKGGQER